MGSDDSDKVSELIKTIPKECPFSSKNINNTHSSYPTQDNHNENSNLHNNPINHHKLNSNLFEEEPTSSSSNEDNNKVAIKSHFSNLITTNKEKKPVMGCPFFSKELTDPQGKNIT